MNDSSENMPRRESVDDQAAHWLVQQDRGLTPKQQDEFLQWLAADSRHRAAFSRHRTLWSDFNLLAQWRPEHSAEPNPDLLARPKPRNLYWLISPLLAAAAVVAVLLVWSASESERGDGPLAFEASAYRQETLPDGSRLEMNRGTHVVVQFTSAERRVLLIEGEAQFHVAKNAAQPFIVRAGGVDVRAVGTAFNVKLAGSNLEVLVTSGKVQVARNSVAPVPSPARPAAADSGALVLAELLAGQRTVMPVAALASPAVLPASTQEIERLLEWQPRLLDFSSTPLAQVVAEFNRRNVMQVVIADQGLADLPIVASIRSDNLEGFVRLLEATAEVRVERSNTGEIRLRRKR